MPTPASSGSARWILTATILGSSMVFIDGTVVSIALPIVQAEFHAGAAEAQWVVEAYTLVLGALMLLCGALADRYGRKRVFLIGVGVFAVGSILCGLAPGMEGLIVARVLQGIGGTLLAPASLALLAANFEGAARGRAVGVWSGLTAVATAIGPVAGGAIVDHAGWRWVFFINVPIAIVVAVLALRHVPESRDEERTGPLDVAGSLSITAGLGALVYGMIEGAQDGRYAVGIVAGVLSLAFIAAFVWFERRARAPILPLHLFDSRVFTGINVATFLLYGALGGLFYFLPFVMIQVDGYDGTVTGMAMVPFVILMVALSRYAGGLVYRVGPRAILTGGPLVVALGFAAFATLPDLHYWTGILPSVILVGIGMGLTVAPLTTTLMDSVPERNVGLASGINNATSRVAGLLAIAALGTLIVAVFNARVDVRMQRASLASAQRADVKKQSGAMAAARFHDPRETAIVQAAYVDGFRIVSLACALLAAGAAIASAATMPTSKSP